MTPLSSALRALREKATRGPFSLAPWDGDDPSEVAECSTILDSEGHDFLNGGRMSNEDAERFVLLANSSEQICAALELAEATSEKYRAYAERFVLLANSSEQICAALELAEATSEKYRAYEERSNEAMRNVSGGGVKDFGLREWDNAVAEACMTEDRALSRYRSATRVGP